jgi:hypothetical protein
MYLLVYVRLLQSVDILTQIVIPSEARDLQFAAICRSLASLGMTNSWESPEQNYNLLK